MSFQIFPCAHTALERFDPFAGGRDDDHLVQYAGASRRRAGAPTKRIPNNLNFYGNFLAGTVSESYNAVLAVGGGKFPYHFSVKSGALPPGISLNPTTGSFSGKPTS